MLDTKYPEILFVVSLVLTWVSFRTKNKKDTLAAQILFFVSVIWFITDFFLAAGSL
jgi:uncharacterized membrane protein YtjA (UPF0391 family)